MQKSIHSAQQRVYLRLLRQLREEANLTQEALANRLQSGQSRVSDYERGERRMDVLELRQYCEALNISLPLFITRLERMLSFEEGSSPQE